MKASHLAYLRRKPPALFKTMGMKIPTSFPLKVRLLCWDLRSPRFHKPACNHVHLWSHQRIRFSFSFMNFEHEGSDVVQIASYLLLFIVSYKFSLFLPLKIKVEEEVVRCQSLVLQVT